MCGVAEDRRGDGVVVGSGADVVSSVDPPYLFRPHPIKLLDPLGVQSGLPKVAVGNEGLRQLKPTGKRLYMTI